MELSWLLVPAVRLMVLEAAPGLGACRICEIAVEDTLVAAITHYWNDHPRATGLVVAGALGLTAFAAAQPGARRRR